MRCGLANAATIHEGDWVRVTLRLSNHAVRHYVAITDTVAGGLQPTDLELAGVAGLDLRTLGGDGSGYFAARQIDDRFARFYAEQLPPGTQEVHYYARAAHPGRYAALPAVAELMYGSAGVARTASTVLDVVGGKR
jgi:uncharacterized protein YfaS (alpha-2-macroglobulin family)